MGLFKKIRQGIISKTSCESQLNRYIAERIELKRNHFMFETETFQIRLKELNFSIELLENVIEKYDEIIKGA